MSILKFIGKILTGLLKATPIRLEENRSCSAALGNKMVDKLLVDATIRE